MNKLIFLSICFLYSTQIFGIRLGLVENDSNLIGICKKAISDATSSGQCKTNIE